MKVGDLVLLVNDLPYRQDMEDTVGLIVGYYVELPHGAHPAPAHDAVYVRWTGDKIDRLEFTHDLMLVDEKTLDKVPNL